MSGFWAALPSLSGPGVIMIGAALFVYALATERLVLGKQYRAERARGDKYEDAHRDVTATLIGQNAEREATVAIVTAFRKELEEFAARGRA